MGGSGSAGGGTRLSAAMVGGVVGRDGEAERAF
jgi:hypothetical protein